MRALAYHGLCRALGCSFHFIKEHMKLFDKLVSFQDNADGVAIREDQIIPDEFLTALRHEREDSLHTPAGEFHRVASIPTAVVDKWLREGFDVFKEPVAAIMKRLRQEQLDGFIASNKV